MKYTRVVITRHGGPEVLQVVEEELPEPERGQARVKVVAAGVAWADTMMRTGLYPGSMPATPFAPGYDIAGTVDKLGSALSTLRVGQPVAAATKVGGYAEFICLPERELVPVPPGLDPAEVTCLPLNYVTAYQMLHRFARVRLGERVLFHGAAGGVGTALLQLGKLAELEMYGTASKSKHHLVESLGGTPIDYQNEDFVERVLSLTGDGVDAAFDPIGGAHLRRSYRTLRSGGRLIAYGERSMVGEGKHNVLETLSHNILMALWKAIPANRIVIWYEFPDLKASNPNWFREDLMKLSELLAQRKIEPVISERLLLAEAARAHELLQKSAVKGKIVLVCNR